MKSFFSPLQKVLVAEGHGAHAAMQCVAWTLVVRMRAAYTL